MLKLHIEYASPDAIHKDAIDTVAPTGVPFDQYVGVEFLHPTGQAACPTNDDLRLFNLTLLPPSHSHPYARIKGYDLDGGGVFYGVASDSSYPTLFWFPRDVLSTLREANRAAIAKQEAKKLPSGVLPPKVLALIKGHYEGSLLSLGEAQTILQLRPSFPAQLSVPKRYTRAYRLLTSVHHKTSSKFGILDVRTTGFVPGGLYRPHTDKVSCWTVSLSMFNNLSGLEDDLALEHKTKLDRCNVILDCDLAAHRTQFLFNPQVLPRLSGMRHYEYQSEVVSAQPVPLKGLVHFPSGSTAVETAVNLRKALSLLP